MTAVDGGTSARRHPDRSRRPQRHRSARHADLGNTGMGGSQATTYGTFTLSSAKSFTVAAGTTVSYFATDGMVAPGTYGAGRSGQSLATIDVSTAAGANNAITAIDNAIASVNSSRADLGAIQNRSLRRYRHCSPRRKTCPLRRAGLSMPTSLQKLRGCHVVRFCNRLVLRCWPRLTRCQTACWLCSEANRHSSHAAKTRPAFLPGFFFAATRKLKVQYMQHGFYNSIEIARTNPSAFVAPHCQGDSHEHFIRGFQQSGCKRDRLQAHGG